MTWLLIIPAFIIAIAIYLYWKIVYTPSLSVTVDKLNYTRGELVSITGSLLGGDVSGKTITLTVTPPSGSDYIIPDVTTETDGSFTTSWNVPSGTVDGIHSLTTATVGAVGSTTFKQYRYMI